LANFWFRGNDAGKKESYTDDTEPFEDNLDGGLDDGLMVDGFAS